MNVRCHKPFQIGGSQVCVPCGCALQNYGLINHTCTLPGCLLVHPRFFKRANLGASALLDFLESNVAVSWIETDERTEFESAVKDLIRYEAGGFCRLEHRAGEMLPDGSMIPDCPSSFFFSLEFHHTGPRALRIGQLRLAKTTSNRLDTIVQYRAEAKRCVLLCKTHHRFVHDHNMGV